MELKVGILGASGYVGNELVKILSKHPKTKLLLLCYNFIKREKERFESLYPHRRATKTGSVAYCHYEIFTG